MAEVNQEKQLRQQMLLKLGHLSYSKYILLILQTTTLQ